MTTPRPCCLLEHRFQALSINHGSLKEEACFNPRDEIAMQQQSQNPSEKCPLEPKSKPALPSQWEQFLDLKTGEMYFYDWSAGRKTKTHPKELLRASKTVPVAQDKIAIAFGVEKPSTPSYYSEIEDYAGDFDSMDDDSDDSEESQKEASEGHRICESVGQGHSSSLDSTVLVAAGCQSCLMYYMLPKHTICCPKCGTPVLHFSEPAVSNGKETREANIG
ncbi:hypothetical protein KI387_001419, partial [Taxus chinensis]